MHALWPTRQNDGGGPAALHFVGSNAMRDDLGIHLCFTHATSNELGVLSAKVDHQNSWA
jgi:hypothetical protein